MTRGDIQDGRGEDEGEAASWPEEPAAPHQREQGDVCVARDWDADRSGDLLPDSSSVGGGNTLRA